MTWPTKSRAAKILGKSVSTIIQMQKTGELHPVKDVDGNWRYDPDELAEFVPEDAASGMLSLTEAISHFRKQSEDLFGFALDCMRLLREENENMRMMRKEEQRAHLDAMVAKEEALNHSTERQVKLKAAESEAAWKQQAVTMAQPALSAILRKFSTGKGANPEVAALSGILTRLTDDDVNALAVLGKMKPEEYEALQRLRGKTGDDTKMPESILAAVNEESAA